MIRMNVDNDLKEVALNGRQLTKLLHNILFVKSDVGVAFKAIYHRHKQSVLEALHKSLLNCLCLHWIKLIIFYDTIHYSKISVTDGTWLREFYWGYAVKRCSMVIFLKISFALDYICFYFPLFSDDEDLALKGCLLLGCSSLGLHPVQEVQTWISQMTDLIHLLLLYNMRPDLKHNEVRGIFQLRWSVLNLVL